RRRGPRPSPRSGPRRRGRQEQRWSHELHVVGVGFPPGGRPPVPPDVVPRRPDRKNRDRIRPAGNDKVRGFHGMRMAAWRSYKNNKWRTQSGHRDGNTRSYRTKSWFAAWLARSSTGPGTMPKTTAERAPIATAVPVNTDGTATTGPSGTGSLKNIRTITRT